MAIIILIAGVIAVVMTSVSIHGDIKEHEENQVNCYLECTDKSKNLVPCGKALVHRYYLYLDTEDGSSHKVNVAESEYSSVNKGDQVFCKVYLSMDTDKVGKIILSDNNVELVTESTN